MFWEVFGRWQLLSSLLRHSWLQQMCDVLKRRPVPLTPLVHHGSIWHVSDTFWKWAKWAKCWSIGSIDWGLDTALNTQVWMVNVVDTYYGYIMDTWWYQCDTYNEWNWEMQPKVGKSSVEWGMCNDHLSSMMLYDYTSGIIQVCRTHGWWPLMPGKTLNNLWLHSTTWYLIKLDVCIAVQNDAKCLWIGCPSQVQTVQTQQVTHGRQNIQVLYLRHLRQPFSLDLFASDGFNKSKDLVHAV